MHPRSGGGRIGGNSKFLQLCIYYDTTVTYDNPCRKQSHICTKQRLLRFRPMCKSYKENPFFSPKAHRKCPTFPLPGAPVPQAARPRYNKTCPVPRRRGGAADTAPFPRPSPAADRVRRRGTPPPRKPLRQKNTRRFRAGCRWFCFCRDYFWTSPKRTAVTAPLPSVTTTLMVCWPAPMLVLLSTVTQPELRPLSPLLLSYVKDFTSTPST